MYFEVQILVYEVTMNKMFLMNGTVKCVEKPNINTLLKILSFVTSHYAFGMQLVVVCNYLGHVYNYKFGIA
jgi:hypothetical protein